MFETLDSPDFDVFDLVRRRTTFATDFFRFPSLIMGGNKERSALVPTETQRKYEAVVCVSQAEWTLQKWDGELNLLKTSGLVVLVDYEENNARAS